MTAAYEIIALLALLCGLCALAVSAVVWVKVQAMEGQRADHDPATLEEEYADYDAGTDDVTPDGGKPDGGKRVILIEEGPDPPSLDGPTAGASRAPAPKASNPPIVEEGESDEEAPSV